VTGPRPYETVEGVVKRRRIKEVLHFTTNRGFLGVLATGQLKSRALLAEDQYLEHLFTPNARFRKDVAWIAHVSMSISRINSEFFAASGRWHAAEATWWCVLALDPIIMRDAGVTFATTNNVYTGVVRGMGGPGLEALFAERVVRWDGVVVHRTTGLPEHLTTDVQAEVLYPGQVSTEHLLRAYFLEEEHAAIAEGQCRAVGHPRVEAVVRPDVLQGRLDA
jgi:hypothetical protein